MTALKEDKVDKGSIGSKWKSYRQKEVKWIGRTDNKNRL